MRPAVLWLALAVGCQGAGDEDPSGTTLPVDTSTAVDTAVTDTGESFCDQAPVVSWENFGAGFVTENCQACHASTATDRQGAPEGATFDTEPEALALADRILARVVDGLDMPPQGGIVSDDRYLVEVWLTCD